MHSIYLEEKYILEYIESMLDEAFCNFAEITDADYHHNTSYKNVPLIIQYGILPIKELKEFNIKTYSDDFLKNMDDINSHANGIDGISLSVLGLTDLYRNEFEYDPRSMDCVDILVSNQIVTSRNSTNYGNEFICYNAIKPNLFRSIDVRILKYLNFFKRNDKHTNINTLISMYNYLKQIAICLKDKNYDILLREMSFESNTAINVDKIFSQPKLVLKK